MGDDSVLKEDIELFLPNFKETYTVQQRAGRLLALVPNSATTSRARGRAERKTPA